MNYQNVDDMVRARQGDERTALLFEDQRWTYAEYVQGAAERAALFTERRLDGPPHVGVLLDNVPEFPLWLAACAVSGSTLVGINPTRQGAELARDIHHTDCGLIVTEARHLPLLEDLDLDCPVLDIDSPAYAELLAEYAGADLPPSEVEPTARFLLLFTSGTTGAPKAVVTGQHRVAIPGEKLSELNELTADSVGYQAMPMFHSNALFAGWSPVLYAGGTHALRRKFSASGFLPDVRRFGATYFNYVGKPLTYILATPEQPDDADNPLVRVFGNEGAPHDLDRFAERFGCIVVDGYGSTEMGASVARVPGMPEGALGAAPPGTCVVNPDTGEECPPAVIDDEGRLTNPDEAVGEIVNKAIGSSFEGYYKNDEANRARLRNGWYWTGDLGYRDADGWFYFAGRDSEWVRVDGENFATAPVERIVNRLDWVRLAVAYAVPDEEVGDQLMVALEVDAPTDFDPVAFDEFLAAQSDLGTKWTPRYVRLTTALPMSHSNKVKKLALRHEKWLSDEPTWWRPHPGEALVPVDEAAVADLRARFAARDRLRELDAI